MFDNDANASHRLNGKSLEPSDLQLISAIARVRTQCHEIEMEIEWISSFSIVVTAYLSSIDLGNATSSNVVRSFLLGFSAR